MKTSLIFIRHGYSESNRNDFFTGQVDSPLTKLGLIQAERAAQYLKDTKIDKVYASPLSRAYNTGLATAKVHGLEVIPDKGLCEIDGGDWHEQPFSSLSSLTPEAYDLWMNDIYRCECPNGEKVCDFFERVRKSVVRIAEENAGKTVCIATHATPIRVISCLAMGYPPEKLNLTTWTPNAAINIFDYEDGSFAPVECNIIKHLEGVETVLPENI